ncbi:MAG TPA: crosslink repair DNA glycosylase YcaQ family protein [Microvirga sp.]|jgi:hypothetical protein|nr:crosslink repair DNA glycosylase YcaQ family protein [Microvirga sp.]
MPRTRQTLSRAEARRLSLAAQGFAEPRPDRPGLRHLTRATERLHLLQIDSVNVFARAHTMPLFSRLGPYAPGDLERASYGGRRRGLFEYWGHEASLIRLDLHPLFRWRMERAARGEGIYGGLARFGRERADFIAAVLAQVEARGALSARELEEGGRSAGPWWGWSDGKRALEWLFWAGRVTTATRRGFERVYDLPERVLPASVLAAPTPAPEDAQRALVRLSARALGIASERDLRDYFRLEVADARARIAELVEAGELLPVTVEGWTGPAYLDPAARIPRRIEARALLSPFDPVVWERSRAERLFDFRYRIEIYTPAEQREFGYYTLPFLLGDRIAARLDLKADRAARRLVVHSIHPEPWADPDALAPALAAELRLAAAWQNLTAIAAPPDWERRLGL